MLWRGRRQSDNIEDDRSDSGGGGIGGGGGFQIPIGGRTGGGGSILLVILVVIAGWYFGFDPSAILGGGFSRLGYGRRIAVVGGIAAVVRILGFVALSAAEGAVWVNVLQYAIPILATVFALRSIFRQRVSRFIDVHRRPARIAPPRNLGAPA